MELYLNMESIAELEEALDYKFKDYLLLQKALSHPSTDFPVEECYQRLEFLGDEVVGLAVSTILFRAFPNAEEGSLTKARANLIDESGLAMLSRQLKLDDMVLLGKGEEKGDGRKKDSIVSDIFESTLAVIYIESGWNKAFSIVDKLVSPMIAASSNIEELLLHINRDYKTRLQEIAQNLEMPLPEYELVDKIGPEHSATFVVRCSAMGYSFEGNGRNKKSAEQEAAKMILIEMRVLSQDV